MEKRTVTLESGALRATLRLPGSYGRSRYDHSLMVEQVCLGKDTFLSAERIGEGDGLGGVGLAFCFEWADTARYDGTAVADCFPQIGVGLLKRTDTAPFLFTRDYPVTPFAHTVETGESYVEVHALPHLCQGTAVDQIRRVALAGDRLIVSSRLENVGPSPIEATEFCHNFFRFNGLEIDGHYRVRFPYTVSPRIRRGQILLERDAVRPGAFDGPTASTAYWVSGFEGLSGHWMQISNDRTGTAVLVEDAFPVCRLYSWSNRCALCPETFIRLSLAPGEALCWERTYRFYKDDH